mgnify:CR=1 FL=1
MRTPVRFLTLLLIPMLIGLGCSTEEELAPAPVNEQTVATAESDVARLGLSAVNSDVQCGHRTWPGSHGFF